MFCVGIPLRDTEWICRGEGSMKTTLVKFHWCLLTANFAWHFTNRKCIRRFYKRFMCFVKYSSFRSKWICIYLRFMILKHCQTIHFFKYCTLIFIIYRMSLIFTYICKDHCKIAHFNDFYLNTCLKNPLALGFVSDWFSLFNPHIMHRLLSPTNFWKMSEKSVQRFTLDLPKHFWNFISFIYSKCQSRKTSIPASTSGEEC